MRWRKGLQLVSLLSGAMRGGLRGIRGSGPVGPKFGPKKAGVWQKWGLALAVLFVGMAGCEKEPKAPMRIGTDVWPGYEPLYLAQHLGELPESDFRLVEFSNSSEVGRAFRNKALEAACLTMDEVFYAVQDGMDPVILLVLDESCGADVLVARKPIESLRELKGKRVAVEVSAVETYTLTRAMQSVGLTTKDVIPVYRPMEQHLSAFLSGSVDAVVSYEPMRTRLLEAGAVELFNSSMIPGEIVDVLAVRRDYLQSHPEAAVTLRKAWFAALGHLRAAPGESAKFLAQREKVTPEQFQVSLKGLRLPGEQDSRGLLEGPSPRLLESAKRLKTVMMEAGLLQKDIQIAPLFSQPEALKKDK